MELFPYALIRLGGNSFDYWDQMDFNNTIEITQSIERLKAEIQIAKEELSEQLFDFISKTEDGKHQNILQNLRRDIYNDRRVRPGKLNQALALLNEELSQQVNGYLKKIEKLKDLFAQGLEIFNVECTSNRKVLQSITSDQSLQKGLVLSSRSLLDQSESYIKKDVESFRNKELKIEQGIIKYLTRMYTKTSPFSTFTNLSMAQFAPLDQEPFKISHSSSKQVSSHIRINNYLLNYLLDLLISYREAYIWLPLRPNPTVEQHEDHFLYLTNNNNIESFQRIPINPVVEYILSIVKEEKEGILFNNLLKVLENEIDADAEELEGYVKQLIDYGLLEYHFGVSGIDPDWDTKLVKKLLSINENHIPYIKELIDTLVEIRNLGNQYAAVDLVARKKIQVQAFESLKTIYFKIHEAAGLPEEERMSDAERKDYLKAKEQEKESQKNEKSESKTDEEEVFTHKGRTHFNLKPEQIFFEDTTREVNAILDHDRFHSLFSKIDDLIGEMQLFKGVQEEKLKMKKYFTDAYGDEASVNLLTFYEDYYRDFKKPEKQREDDALKKAREKADDNTDESKDKEPKDSTGSEEVIPEIKELYKQKEAWQKACKNELESLTAQSNGDISFSIDIIKRINKTEGIKVDHKTKKNSFGSFAQFYIDSQDGRLKTVLNSTFSGYGKMLSRFLHIFDDQVTDNVRDWNSDLADENSLFVEDCDGSYFNANLHPTLMPYEIWMPGGHNTLPVDQQLPITDFIINLDNDKDQLKLTHRVTGKTAYIFDLGFQSLMGRSQLFQLLEKFSGAQYLSAHYFIGTVNQWLRKESDPNKSKEEVTVSPRIIYDDDIILQRKSWFVPKALIPLKESTETDWEYYVKLNLWRRQHSMPDEVFIFINPDRWNKTIKEDSLKKVTRDDYKPQYINFNNPLLVKLFERSVVKVPISLKVEEMLPNSEQMLQIDNKRFVSEFVIQWYNNKN